MKKKDAAALTHLDEAGRARMVDVGRKRPTRRSAAAEAWVDVGPQIAPLVAAGGGPKGNVLETARLAGVIAAKRTAELIPLCHPLGLESIDVEASVDASRVRLVATARCHGRTGVEMEAMTAAAVAALCVYDMVKALNKGVAIGPIRLLEKRGGKSGHWKGRPADGSR